jgi:phosphate transport system ATP-binding protein
MIPSTKPPKHMKTRPPLAAEASEIVDTGPPKIEIRSLNFFYGELQALHNVNMTLADRSITAFIGPSGCGKSTLLRVLNRMYALYPKQRAEGEVLIGGKDILGPVVDVAELRYRVGMVFQKPTPFPMSVFDNVAFGLRLAGGVRAADLKLRVESALRDAAIWDEVKDKLAADGRSLSGGQQQRLCIARAVAVRPEVLLLDEPTAALDPRSQSQIIDLLIGWGDGKKTVITATHDLGLVEDIADDCFLLQSGKLIAHREPGGILNDEALLRSSNLIHEHRHAHPALGMHTHPHTHRT